MIVTPVSLANEATNVHTARHVPWFAKSSDWPRSRTESISRKSNLHSHRGQLRGTPALRGPRSTPQSGSTRGGLSCRVPAMQEERGHQDSSSPIPCIFFPLRRLGLSGSGGTELSVSATAAGAQRRGRIKRAGGRDRGRGRAHRVEQLSAADDARDSLGVDRVQREEERWAGETEQRDAHQRSGQAFGAAPVPWMPPPRTCSRAALCVASPVIAAKLTGERTSRIVPTCHAM